ncbi:unnamed protein product [Polarella glacialis]|uniref:3-oxo-5-alpha-steroid 4-dehydrogenase C-terminal domain-containing protein n=1 Tax=Polarella glacialis TaxID=89957 RepID=A0A813JD00_POLGL|nr:unnamed protein product [Polarella glacialis]CAE8676799.1 unnamed protein product [Polarella glacialis]|mmetsp:Transcript_75683/g.122207  ORF Transcript_75683/g.122207 Transcript_75683/m.122207 type:complete len:176 (-) Transcript_75683:47-574(-)
MLECSCIHIYSSPMDLFTTVYLGSCYIVIGLIFAYDLGPALQPPRQPFGGVHLTAVWVVIWFVGEATNGFHHWLLSRLRSNTSGKLSESLTQHAKLEYSLPTGGLFNKLLFPHYLGEMVGWLAFALMVNRGGVWGLNFFMLFLQCGRASAGRQWYVERFGAEAIASKWCLIPMIF